MDPVLQVIVILLTALLLLNVGALIMVIMVASLKKLETMLHWLLAIRLYMVLMFMLELKTSVV